jgi:hypothetical protein
LTEGGVYVWCWRAAALISLGVEARWEQAGPLTIDSTGATGTHSLSALCACWSLGSRLRHRFTLLTQLLDADGHIAKGVSVGSSSSWYQSGPVLIDVSSVVVSPPFSLPPKVCGKCAIQKTPPTVTHLRSQLSPG